MQRDIPVTACQLLCVVGEIVVHGSRSGLGLDCIKARSEVGLGSERILSRAMKGAHDYFSVVEAGNAVEPERIASPRTLPPRP